MTREEFCELVRRCLAGLHEAVERVMNEQLTRRCETDPGAAVFFLVCPHRYGIWLPEEEEPILAPEVVLAGLDIPYLHSPEAEEINAHALVQGELLVWLADRWTAVNGPGRWGPAFAVYEDPMSYHLLLLQPRYDLQQRRWVWEKAPLGDRPQGGDIPF